MNSLDQGKGWSDHGEPRPPRATPSSSPSQRSSAEITAARSRVAEVLGPFFLEPDLESANANEIKERVARTIAGLCANARADNISVEELIVDIKDVCGALPEARPLPPHRRVELQNLLVSACIEMYYAP